MTLIGTGHVFQIQQTVRDAIQALSPDVVFVELDKGRLHALVAKRRGAVPQKGGLVQRRLARFQEEVAQQYGGEVGGEMLAAVEGARAVGAKVALIDRPAEQTLRRAMKQITWREKARIVGLGFVSLWRRIVPGKTIEDEVQAYQDDPLAALAQLKGRFPTIHRVVIEERDSLMAGRIQAILEPGQRGVAVVGDGHVEGMLDLLKGLDVTTYRMAAVREGKLPKPVAFSADGVDVDFGFDIKV